MSDKQGLPTGKHTLVEEGTEFTGKMSSSCPIVVMGKVEGDITGPVIHITPTGVVSGVVKVKQLRSDGELAGDIEADTVEISGRVRDRTVIRARSLEVSLSTTKGGMQVVFGECELAVGDEPNKDAAVAAALAPPAPAVAAAPDVKPEAKPAEAKTVDAKGKPVAAAAPAVTTEPVDADGKRRRGTIPPPSPT
jgi:cytoskeletal protein CcmA (bactofilin family)